METVSFDNFLIREYRESDYIEVNNLWTRTDLGRPERGDDRETIQETLKTGGCLLVMVEKSTGLLTGTSWMTNDGRRIFIHHFGILPEFQGYGLANELMKESLRFVKRKGLQVKLEVHSSNYKAINLYKKFGFDQLGDYNILILRDISKVKV